MKKIITEDINEASSIFESGLLSEAVKFNSSGYFKLTKKILKDGAADEDDIETVLSMVDTDTDIDMDMENRDDGSFIIKPEGKKDFAAFVKYTKELTSITGKVLEKAYKKPTKLKGGDEVENENISTKWLQDSINFNDEVYGYSSDAGFGGILGKDFPSWQKVAVVWETPLRWSFVDSDMRFSLLSKDDDRGHKGGFVVLNANSKKGGDPK